MCAVRRTRFAHWHIFKCFILFSRRQQDQEKKKNQKGGGKRRCVMISRWYARCAVGRGASGMRVISVTLLLASGTTSSCTPMSFSVQRVITRAGATALRELTTNTSLEDLPLSRDAQHPGKKSKQGCRGASRLPLLPSSSIESKRRCSNHRRSVMAEAQLAMAFPCAPWHHVTYSYLLQRNEFEARPIQSEA